MTERQSAIPRNGSSGWVLGTSTDSYHHIVIQHTCSSSSSELGSDIQNTGVSKADMAPDLVGLAVWCRHGP